MDTATGIVSLSVPQTLWAIGTARRIMLQRGGPAELTNHDIAWLLVNGWDPTGWATAPEPAAGHALDRWTRLLLIGLLTFGLVAVILAMAGVVLP